MPSKENYCYRIMNSHSLIVDFKGTPSRVKVPAVKDGETFKQWKKQVLGDEVTNVVVYIPEEPAPQTKIKTLQNWSGTQHLRQIFKAFGKSKDIKKNEAVESAKNEVEHTFVTFPRDTLDELLDEHGNSLEPSVRDFFQRFLAKTEEDIDTEVLLRDLIVSYNNIVRMFREKNS